MTKLTTVAEIDVEIQRLEQMRANAIANEAITLQRQIDLEKNNFNTVQRNYFQAHLWGDEKRTFTHGTCDIVEIITENVNFFIAIEVDREGFVITTEYPGPKSFEQKFSRHPK